jgi:glucose/arabinose dehydrogenase
MSKRTLGIIATLVLIFILLVATILGIVFLVNRYNQNRNTDVPLAPPITVNPPTSVLPAVTGTPKLRTEDVLTGLNKPWDVIVLQDGKMLFTQRSEGLFLAISGANTEFIYRPEDLHPQGEGGMLSIAIPADFANSLELFACFNTRQGSNYEVRVAKLELAADLKRVLSRVDIVTGIPAQPGGRHSGCRLQFDSDDQLWVGTGDAAMAANPQSATSLAGKVLRIDRDGNAAPGNLTSPFDKRIFSYGHRNVQGLALYPEPVNGNFGFSAEHGSNEDDEVNKLEKGNFGWDPQPPYLESVPMTDKTKFPAALDADWSSGKPTIAPSGLTFLRGEQWGDWNGSLVMAILRGEHIRLLRPERDGSMTDLGKVLTGFGRIRSVHQGVDGYLYFTTDNGGGRDKIVRVIPEQQLQQPAEQ